MPLIILGIIVAIAAVAIFSVNKWQAGRYTRKLKNAKVADDAVDDK